MDFLPLFHKLQDRPVLVVGGGEVALRKSRLLAEAGAQLRVVAPDVDEELRVLAGAGVHLRGYQSSDLQGVVLVIAATDDEALNARISEEAQALCIPVNVVDAPKLCSVIFPAIVDRSPVLVAIGTGDLDQPRVGDGGRPAGNGHGVAIDEQGAAVVASRIREGVAKLAIPHGGGEAGGIVTVSLGVATVTPEPSMKHQDLIAWADRALYQAKHAGRNRVAALSAS